RPAELAGARVGSFERSEDLRLHAGLLEVGDLQVTQQHQLRAGAVILGLESLSQVSECAMQVIGTAGLAAHGNGGEEPRELCLGDRNHPADLKKAGELPADLAEDFSVSTSEGVGRPIERLLPQYLHNAPPPRAGMSERIPESQAHHSAGNRSQGTALAEGALEGAQQV